MRSPFIITRFIVSVNTDLILIDSLLLMACQIEYQVPVDDSSSSTPHFYSLFTPGDRVVLQSAWKGDVFNGTVRWVGPIRKANLCDPIPVVGVEIVSGPDREKRMIERKKT